MDFEGMGNSGPGLSGVGSIVLGPSMFPNIPKLDIEPDPEEMDKEFVRAQFDTTVKLERIEVKTFDLSKPKNARDYEKLLSEIYTGIKLKTHMILFTDRQFVSVPGVEPRWMSHIEYAVFSYKKEPIRTVNDSNK